MVHLDLSPWATAPVRGGLSQGSKQALTAQGVPWLLRLLEVLEMDLLMVNGRTASGVVLEVLAPQVVVDREWVEFGGTRVEFAEFSESIRVLAWSTNLQAAHVSGETRSLIMDGIAERARGFVRR